MVDEKFCCDKYKQLVEEDEGVIPKPDGSLDVVGDSGGPRNWFYSIKEEEKWKRLKFNYCPYCGVKLVE